jgi:hypothetical protein
MLRVIRKHRIALIALAVYHFVFFFPTLFMHRVVSPNDVFYNFDPWRAVGSADVQNSLLNDPPTAYYTLMSLLRGDWRAFHWNPFVACGIPGFGSSAAAVLSPFVSIPTFLAPLWCVYTGIILLKLNVAFLFGYLWLREERLGKAAAAIGAIIIAAAGPVAVRWWWQVTNPTALYPALLWMVCRAIHGKRIPVWLVAVISLTYALSGFPAAMAYGAWLCLAYAAFLLIRERSRPRFQAAIPAILGIAIALPSIVPMVQLIERTGYLAARANVAAQFAFPLDHFANFVDPDRLGNPAYHKWGGNYVEGTVYVGLIAIPLAIASIAARRARSRWFWLAVLAIVLGCMFGVPLLSSIVAHVPGIKYSPLTRLVLLLPTIIGYLAAAGSAWVIRSRRSPVAALLALLLAADLGVFAGRFYPYLEPSAATPPRTPILAFLQSQPKPFRIAPFFDFLWPNSSELYRLEDIRSHFSSEAKYRRLLQRIDPSSVLTRSTVIQFNSLHFDFTDPLVSMLGVRYFLEQNNIEIIKWTTFKYTTPGVKENGAIRVQPGTTLQRHIVIGSDPFFAIELPVSVEQTFRRSAQLQVSLLRGTTTLYSRGFLPADIAVVGKVYIPLRPYARKGDTLLLRVQPIGLRVSLLKGDAVPGDAPIFYGRVAIPVIFDRQLPDGRLFLNLTEVPRFHAVTRLREMSEEQFLAAKDVDFSQEAILTGAGKDAGATSPAEVHLVDYAEDRQVIDVHATGDAFLASSEKLTPELRVSIDGRRVRPAEINLLFAGVRVPAGNHRVVFWRRIGGDWWWLSAMAAMAAIALSVIDVVRR